MRTFACRHSVTLLLAAALTAAHWPGRMAAQAPESRLSLSSVRAGDTVRVWSRSPVFRGAVAEVSSINADTLNLHVVRSRRPVAGNVIIVPPSLSRLDVQDGRRRSAGKIVGGVILGMVLGGVAGGGLGVLAECGRSCSDQGEYAGLAGIVYGGGIGAIAGAVGGGMLGSRKVPRWRRVALDAR